MQQDIPKKQRPRGIYLLPNLLTTAALFAGFYAVTSAMNGQFEMAAELIFIAMILDGLDGRVARLTNTQSAFGAEYDSLADMVSFGVAPALVIYAWALASLGKGGWVAVFVHAAGAALRLARFNTQLAVQDKRYFQGLNCTFAAAFLASFVGLCHQHAWSFAVVSVLSASIAILSAALMVSNIRYYSFKDLDFKGKIPFLYVLIIVIIFVAIAANPMAMVFLGSLLYALSGPFQNLFYLHRMRKQRRKFVKVKDKDINSL